MTTILVTGATGTIGSQLIPQLTGPGVTVRALVRRRDDAATLPDQVEVAIGDFGDPTSLAAATEGVDVVFLACGNVADQVQYECAVIDAAVAVRAARLVKLSARGARIGAAVAYWDWHGRIERHLRSSALPAVILQPGFLMTNLLAAAEHIRQQGLLVAPAGTARVAMIDPADVASVAARALMDDRYDGRTLVLTGPRAITYQEVAVDLSAVLDREVHFLDLPSDAAGHALVESGLPPFAADQIVAVFDDLRSGGQAVPSGTVEEVTGCAPRSFSEFAERMAGVFGITQPAR